MYNSFMSCFIINLNKYIIMNYRKDNIELIGKNLELEGQIIELKKVLVICASERYFFKSKFAQCNEWGGSEEYLTGKVSLNKLNPVLGIDKKLN